MTSYNMLHFFLVFCRKSLCEAKHEMQSVFKFSNVPHMSDRYTPLVEASSGQEQYYIRSAWHFQIFRCTQYIWTQTYPPVQASSGQEEYYVSQVRLTFWGMQLRRQITVRCTPLVETSSGQEQYYVRSALHFLIWCSAIGEVSHTLQYRRY